jgi:hypothetical protein
LYPVQQILRFVPCTAAQNNLVDDRLPGGFQFVDAPLGIRRFALPDKSVFLDLLIDRSLTSRGCAKDSCCTKVSGGLLLISQVPSRHPRPKRFSALFHPVTFHCSAQIIYHRPCGIEAFTAIML